MQRQSMTLLACLVLAVVGALWWFFAADLQGTPGVPSGGTSPAGTGVAAVAPAAADQKADAAARSAADEPPPAPAAAADEGLGSLLVHVVWSDGQPAADVGIHVVRWRMGHPYAVLAKAVSDTSGTARFQRLETGEVGIRSDRGGDAKVEIAAGREQEATFKVPEGVAVEGSVRDDAGKAVAGADIWLTAPEATWAGGRVITQSGADGTFRLRDVPKDQSLGALSPGFAPSALVDLEDVDLGKTPVQIELRLLRPGGRIEGRVVDARQRPVAAARVAVGRGGEYPQHGIGGRRTDIWQPRTALTDEQGAFVVESLAPGKPPVEAWSERHPIWHGACEVKAAETTQVLIELADGVTVHGTVRGSDQMPLARAIVRAFPIALQEQYLQFGQFDYDSVFGYPFALTDGKGSYRVTNVAPGAVHLYATAEPERRAREESIPWDAIAMEGTPGADLEWNAVVDAGLALEGVVLFRDGSPMAQVFVTAYEAGTATRHVITTDKQGRFRHVRLKNKPYDVAVQLRTPPADAPALVKRGVFPGHENLRLVASYDPRPVQAPGKVRGRVHDQAGRLRGPLAVSLSSGRTTRPATIKGLEFSFERVEPGEFRLHVMTGEDVIHVGPTFNLQAGADLDLGAIVTEPAGTVLLRIERPEGTAELAPRVGFTREGGGWRTVQPGTAADCRIDNLCPGRYRVSAYGERLAMSGNLNCDVAAGAETQVTIRLRTGVQREMVVDYGPGQTVKSIRLLEAGTVIWDHAPGSYALPRPYSAKLTLPLGSFVLRAETTAGVVQEVPFTMKSLDKDQPAVRVDLN